MRKLELPCEIGDLVYEVFFDEELKRAVMVPPHKVEDVSVYSILIGGDWTSRSEIGKTLFFEPEEAVKACAEMNATKGVSIEIGDHIYEVFFDRELNFGPVVFARDFARDVEDVSVYSILIGGDWTSRSEIGKTVFFEPEEAVKACAEMNARKGVPIEIGDLVYEVVFDEELKRVTLEPPREVEDVAEYSISIGGRWVSRSEIGKTLFFEPERAVATCLKMSYGIGWLNIVADLESGETHAKENDDASDFD